MVNRYARCETNHHRVMTNSKRVPTSRFTKQISSCALYHRLVFLPAKQKHHPHHPPRCSLHAPRCQNLGGQPPKSRCRSFRRPSAFHVNHHVTPALPLHFTRARNPPTPSRNRPHATHMSSPPRSHSPRTMEEMTFTEPRTVLFAGTSVYYFPFLAKVVVWQKLLLLFPPSPREEN